MNSLRQSTSPVQEETRLDQLLRQLQARKTVWARLPIASRIELLERVHDRVGQHAARWVKTANAARDIPPESPWAAEEWYEIYSVARALRCYESSLRQLASGRSINPGRLFERPSGQLVARVFPYDRYDWMLFNGITADVWLQPGTTRANLDRHMARFYREAAPQGAIALVLGAGNLNSIAPLDALDCLFGTGQVTLLKLSPVNAYLQPVLAEMFKPLIDFGALAIVSGDAHIGRYLTHHTAVDSIHLTGANATYETIRRQLPVSKPMTTELGGVTPVIVVPGRWSTSALRYQADNLVTMKLFNGGFNCIAAQVLILPQAWSQRGDLLDALRSRFDALPQQPLHYPGAQARQAAARADYPTAEALGRAQSVTLIPDLDACAAQRWQCEEFFGPVLAVTTLPGNTPAAFLHNAVAFCNQRLFGTLGLDLLIDPHTQQVLGPALDTAVAELQYGSIGLNMWCGLNYRLMQTPWGAFQDMLDGGSESGKGSVHNTLLFDTPQKTVIRGPFHAFPYTWLNREASFLPRPPWFVAHKRREATARRIAQLELTRSPARLPGIFASALLG